MWYTLYLSCLFQLAITVVLGVLESTCTRIPLCLKDIIVQLAVVIVKLGSLPPLHAPKLRRQINETHQHFGMRGEGYMKQLLKRSQWAKEMQ